MDYGFHYRRFGVVGVTIVGGMTGFHRSLEEHPLHSA